MTGFVKLFSLSWFDFLFVHEEGLKCEWCMLFLKLSLSLFVS